MEIIQMINTCFQFWFALENPLWEDYYENTSRDFFFLGAIDISPTKWNAEASQNQKFEIKHWSHQKRGCCKEEPSMDISNERQPATQMQPLCLEQEAKSPVTSTRDIKIEVANARSFTELAEHIDFGKRDKSTESASFTAVFSGSGRGKRAWARNNLRSVRGSLRRRSRVTSLREDGGPTGTSIFGSLRSSIRHASSTGFEVAKEKSIRRLFRSTRSSRRRSIFRTFSYE
jgi:hypothetical protein